MANTNHSTLTALQLNDVVRAVVTAQGMTAGATYVITDVRCQSTPFGVFTTYELDGRLHVGNGHLLLSRVDTLATPVRRKRTRRPRSKSARQIAAEACGLKKVRGALGGTYYE